MTVGKAIYYLLTNASDVTAIVGTRIYPEVAQQNAALPYIVYNVSNNEPSDTKREPSKLDTAEVEVNVFSEKYTQAIDMGVAVRAALDRVKGTYNGVNVQSIQYINEIIDFDEPQRAYNITADYEVRISRTDFEIAQGSPITGVTLGELSDVSVAGVTDNQILSYDAATGNWVPADDAGGLVNSVNGLTGTVILNFDDLNDVDTGTPSDGQLIAYQQGEWVTIDQDELHIPINSVTGLQTELNTIPTDLSDLSDVSIVGTPAGNQALIYNSATNAFTSQDSYTNRFEDEVETGKVMPTIFAERAYSVKSEGDGVFIDPESDTPAAGKVIVRKIYHKAGFITDADVIGDYTLIHTFADDTAYADTVATFEGFRDGNTYGTPPFTLLQTWAEETAAPTFTGLLNESYGSGAEAAYSTRRLNGNITDCMVIRRASDSTTQTIGFDANGNIDEAAITTFCTGTSCTVETWKDQSGNGNDATQSTPANQPTIYTGGALVKENGRVAVQFAEQFFSLTSAITPTEYSAAIVMNPTQLDFATFGSTVGYTYVTYYRNTNDVWFYHGNTGRVLANSQATGYQLNWLNWTGSTVGIGKDGGTMITGALSGTPSITQLATSDAGGTSLRSTGTYQEMIFWATDQNAAGNRTQIESNVGGYFTQNTPLLDTYSGAAAAYSLRKLSSSYSGNAIRVRRSSDNTEQDIGFNVFGELDTVSLAAFCSGTNGFVKTWYSQVGTGIDATQTNTANQPKIYDSSTGVVTRNGKPCIISRDPVTSTYYGSLLTSSTIAEPYSVSFVGRNNLNYGFVLGSNEQIKIQTGSTLFLSQDLDGGNNLTELYQHIFGVGNGSSSLGRVLATSAQPSVVSFTSAGSDFNISIIGGRHANASSSNRVDYSELIVWNSDQSSNRANIESNINTFYSIY